MAYLCESMSKTLSIQLKGHFRQRADIVLRKETGVYRTVRTVVWKSKNPLMKVAQLINLCYMKRNIIAYENYYKDFFDTLSIGAQKKYYTAYSY